VILLATTLILSSGAALPAMQRRTEKETGSNIPVPRRARIPEDSTLKRAQVRLVLNEFVRCAVDRQASRLEAALATLDDGFNTVGAVLSTNECLESGQMKFKAVALRGPLFAELYRRKAAAEAKGRSWGPAVTRVNLAAKPETDIAKEHLGLMGFAHCVVESDRAGAQAAVLAPTASDAQNAAIAALAPKLGPCLPQGSSVRLGKDVLEGGLAEVLYRGVVPTPAAEPAAASGAKQ